jgi:aminopeptidase N
MKTIQVIILAVAIVMSASILSVKAQPFTRQDTLRGSITPEREWWDLNYYDLAIDFDIANKRIKGTNTIRFHVLKSAEVMQIDLQEPLQITKVMWGNNILTYAREGNVYWIRFPHPMAPGTVGSITISYEGIPVEAKRPPWDGGLTWTKDEMGNPFVATTCQGLGASVWWPCKDHMYDEADSMRIRVTTPADLMDVSNGRLRRIDYHNNGRRTYEWFVSNPINNYGVNANIANYVHWTDTLHGEKGVLDLDFYVLPEHYEKAKTHFQDAHRTLRALEYWFGPYPFYEDGFKLVEVPYLGMEHQSSVTYGNGFLMGYRGRDLSSTGWGLKWDFIIVHETAHEWFANNVTYKDIADMWIHESFANYAENLFTEYYYGPKAGSEYVIGTRLNIQNDVPIIGHYNVNKEGSGDMYYKGGNMLHNLRQWINDDVKWRSILRGINEDFYHQTVTTEQIESYIAEKSGLKLNAFFNQYLRDTRIPVLEYEMSGKSLKYRYINIVPGFSMPVDMIINNNNVRITPTNDWQTYKCAEKVESVAVDADYYIDSRNVKE